jgi:hypothetical protein
MFSLDNLYQSVGKSIFVPIFIPAVVTFAYNSAYKIFNYDSISSASRYMIDTVYEVNKNLFLPMTSGFILMNTYKNFLELNSISHTSDREPLFALMLYQGCISSILSTSCFLYPEKKLFSNHIKINKMKVYLTELASIISSAFIMHSLINCMQEHLDDNPYDLSEEAFFAICGACEFYFYNISHNYFEDIIQPFYIEEKTN